MTIKYYYFGNDHSLYIKKKNILNKIFKFKIKYKYIKSALYS